MVEFPVLGKTITHLISMLKGFLRIPRFCWCRFRKSRNPRNLAQKAVTSLWNTTKTEHCLQDLAIAVGGKPQSTPGKSLSSSRETQVVSKILGAATEKTKPG